MVATKKRAIIYPYGREAASLVRHRELLKDYEIVSLVSPKGWGIIDEDAGQADKGENIGIKVSGDFEKALEQCDAVIIMDYNKNEKLKNRIVSNIHKAIAAGKEVVCASEFDGDTIEKLQEEYGSEKHCFRYIKEKKSDFSVGAYDETLLEIETPVIFVGGLTENTSKFEIQLSLREKLINQGYKVSQVGTKSYCELFGFHSIPEFMFKSEIGEKEKIVSFNRYIKEIEKTESPDLIIVGIPGGLMPFNKKLTNNFAVTAFLISQALTPDFTIISILFEIMYPRYFEMLKTSFKYKYGFEVDCFNLSSARVDYTASNDRRKICLDYFSSLDIDKVIEGEYMNTIRPVFNILSSSHSEKMLEYLIDTLSKYGDREQISIGGI
ncbi:TIGR04066 family peptide maturation system protein [Clostridium sp. YIM B02505]|uniref:TIGR04066 family peptide maturation system protein n=1 Tax=Clostridium yunnanense TaxID=2800325 RepID=A0ABS1EMT6_9CLOT|nr:TIGR04066 family peptide maturation system protein [Clostridium yunnanense]MBK1810690.1 TIGR04066 family peptide maturation system protein [Clostridium yunnanense]